MIGCGQLVLHKTISQKNKIIRSQMVRKLGTERKDPVRERKGPRGTVKPLDASVGFTDQAGGFLQVWPGTGSVWCFLLSWSSFSTVATAFHVSFCSLPLGSQCSCRSRGEAGRRENTPDLPQSSGLPQTELLTKAREQGLSAHLPWRAEHFNRGG